MKFSQYDIYKQVSIPLPLYKSEIGKYFIGQTPILNNLTNKGLAALYNPSTSNVNIYLNAITVTSMDAAHISAEIFLGTNMHNGESYSTLYRCTNTDIQPPPQPSGKIQYFSSIINPPNGVPIFSRLVAPMSTEVIDGGQIIIAPGNSVFVYLGGFQPFTTGSYIVAFGWWENNVMYCNR